VWPDNMVRVNCGTIVDGKWGLFGADAGYVGSHQKNEIAEFMQRHDNKFGVCILEEFEKIPGKDAKEALLHPFESGEWAIKGGITSKPANCSKIIFFLTSNLINKQITDKLISEGLVEKNTTKNKILIRKNA